MFVSELRAERAQRRRKRRVKSAAVAAVFAAAMLALTAAVFAVATTSRQVAADSSRVHHLDELITSTTVIRAQLGFGLVLADVGQFANIDTSDAVATAETDVELALTALDASRVELGGELSGLDQESALALAEFEEFARSQMPLNTDGAVDPTAAAELEVVYADAIALLTVARDGAIDSVEQADQSLGRLSSLVSFLTAFVIPSLALVIYRMLSVPARELLEAEARTSRDTALAEIRRAFLLNRLDQLQAMVNASANTDTDGGDRDPSQAQCDPAVIADRVEDVRRSILTMERSQRCAFGDVAVADVVAETAKSVGARSRLVHSGRTDAVAWTDAELFGMLLDSLVADGRQRGATQFEVVTDVDDEMVIVSVANDGAPRSPSECEIIVDQPTVTDRLALLGGPDVDLVAALHLAEDLQGSIEFAQAHGRQFISLRLPAGSGVDSGGRNQTLVATRS